MKKGLLLKILILLVCIIIIIIVFLLLKVKNNNEDISIVNNYIKNEIVSNNTDVVDDNNINVDINDVWYHFDHLSYYKTVLSLEIYIQKYFEKNKLIGNDFLGFNINDVWYYTIMENDQQIDEYYIDGYVYNSNYSMIKEVAIKFSLDENNLYKIDNIDLTNTSWNSIISGKTQEINNNWDNIKKQFEIQNNDDEDEDIDENEINIFNEDDEDEEENVEIPESKYNEKEFTVLDIRDNEMINRYFINYKIKTLVNKEEAYKLLHEDTKNSIFRDYETFENRIQNYINNTTKINKVKIVTPIRKEDGQINNIAQYIFTDENKNMYGIEIKGINDYFIAITRE